MPPDALSHAPVMLSEVVAALAPAPGRVFVDCTYGRGGHTRELLRRIGPQGRILALDRDPEAVEDARRLAAHDARVTARHARFARLAEVAAHERVVGQVHGILFDLGVSSPQLEAAPRGFSLRADGPLDMRMDPGEGESAAEWLAHASESEIARVVKDYGEERHARRIARAVVAARAAGGVATTRALADLVARAVPRRGNRARGEPEMHPATRTFQAIRIHVNAELDELDAALAQVPDVLAPRGRLAVVSFHSLEDRRVKRFIRREEHGPALPRGLPVRGSAHRARLRALGRARRPGDDEIAANPRARSAVLRVAEACA